MDVMTVIGAKTSGLCSKLHILGNIVVLQTLDLLSNQNTWDICINNEARPLWSSMVWQQQYIYMYPAPFIP